MSIKYCITVDTEPGWEERRHMVHANPLSAAATEPKEWPKALEGLSSPQPPAPTLTDYKYNRLWQIAPPSSALNSIW